MVYDSNLRLKLQPYLSNIPAVYRVALILLEVAP